MSVVGRRSLTATAALIVGVGGCGTEPSDGGPRVYRLVAVDSSVSGTVPCFASSWQYSDGALVRQEDCDVSLRGFEARFDSAGPIPMLIFTASVRSKSGGAATWQIGIPTTIENNTIQYDFSSVETPYTAEQAFVVARAGTFVNGVLTLLMPQYSSSGLPDRTEYFRQGPTVFALTADGRPLRPSALADRYVGVSFSGLPADYCTTATVSMPGRCFHRSFTLSSAGSPWLVDYHEVVTADADTLGGMSLTDAGLTVVAHRNAFVRVSSSGPGQPGDLLRFDAQGFLVGRSLTLFTTYYSFDGTPLVSPIIAAAE